MNMAKANGEMNPKVHSHLILGKVLARELRMNLGTPFSIELFPLLTVLLPPSANGPFNAS